MMMEGNQEQEVTSVGYISSSLMRRFHLVKRLPPD